MRRFVVVGFYSRVTLGRRNIGLSLCDAVRVGRARNVCVTAAVPEETETADLGPLYRRDRSP